MADQGARSGRNSGDPTLGSIGQATAANEAAGVDADRNKGKPKASGTPLGNETLPTVDLSTRSSSLSSTGAQLLDRIQSCVRSFPKALGNIWFGHKDEQQGTSKGPKSKLSEETNSFYITAPIASAPFYLALFVSVFKIGVFVLAWQSVADQRPVVATDIFLALAQVVSLFIAAMSQDDVTNGVKLFHEGYYAVKDAEFRTKRPHIGPPEHEREDLLLNGDIPNCRGHVGQSSEDAAGQAGQEDLEKRVLELEEKVRKLTSNEEETGESFVSKAKWSAAVCTHTVEGALGLFVTYLFIVRSSTVLDTLLNFAAVEFVAVLDNAFFELSKHGFLGQACLVEAKLVEGKEYDVKGRHYQKHWCFRAPCCQIMHSDEPVQFGNFLKALLRFFVFLILLSFWIVLVVTQQRGTELPVAMIVQFDDGLLPSLTSYSGTYKVKQEGIAFSTNRFVWKNELSFSVEAEEGGSGAFRFCSPWERWTFSVQDKKSDPCHSSIVVSSVTAKYDFWETETLSWFVRSGSQGSAQGRSLNLMESFTISPICGTRKDRTFGETDQCNGGGCKNNVCECPHGRIGKRCQWRVDEICTKLVIDVRYGPLAASRQLATQYELLNETEELLLVYDHPVYVGDTTFHSGLDVLIYTGLRWTIVSSEDGFYNKTFQYKSEIYEFLRDNFKANSSIAKVDLVSEKVRVDSSEDNAAPLELQWIKPLERDNFNSLKVDTSSNEPANLICGVCTGKDGVNPCLHTGVCTATRKCECRDGEKGARCQKLPLGDGNCNREFNTAEHRFDGGDCCESTCVDGEFECGMASFASNDIVHTFWVGFPYCLDTNVLGSCRGVVEKYGAGCWISGCVGGNCWVEENLEPFQKIGIYQPKPEQVLLSHNGSTVAIIENKGIEFGGSRIAYLFAAEQSKYVYSATGDTSIEASLVEESNGHMFHLYSLATRTGTDCPSGYHLYSSDNAGSVDPSNFTCLHAYGYERWSWSTESSAPVKVLVNRAGDIGDSSEDPPIIPDSYHPQGDVCGGVDCEFLYWFRKDETTPGQPRLFASEDVLTLRLPDKRGIQRYHLNNGTIVGQGENYAEHGPSGRVVFSQSARGDGVLVQGSDTFLYLPVNSGNATSFFGQPIKHNVSECNGIEAIAFVEQSSTSVRRRLNILCKSRGDNLRLVQFDLTYNKSILLREFESRNAETARFSGDGSTLVFDESSQLVVRSRLTNWTDRIVQPKSSGSGRIESYAISGDGSTIVIASSSLDPQVFRVIPLRCEDANESLELLINVRILYYDVKVASSPQVLLRFFDTEGARVQNGPFDRRLDFEDQSQKGEQFCLSNKTVVHYLTLESQYRCDEQKDDELCNFFPRQSRFSYAVSLDGYGCCSGYVDGFGERRCYLTGCGAGEGQIISSAPTLQPTQEKTAAPSEPQPITSAASPQPSAAPSSAPTTAAPTASPSLRSIVPTASDTPIPTVQSSLLPSQTQNSPPTPPPTPAPTPLPTPPPTQAPVIVPTASPTSNPTPFPTATPTPNPTPSPTTPAPTACDCTWPNLCGCDKFVRADDESPFGGPIPTTIGLWTSLTSLNLNSNRFSGTLPTEIGRLTNLVLLQLYGNRLRGTIPSELGRLTKLRTLWLDANRFTGTIPTTLGGLSAIRNLDMQTNYLTGTIPTEFDRCSNLKGLSLWTNDLVGSVPSQLCARLPDKIRIDCDEVLCEPGCCRGMHGTEPC